MSRLVVEVLERQGRRYHILLIIGQQGQQKRREISVGIMSVFYCLGVGAHALAVDG